VRFFSATFGAGVVATQRPITCPKRQLQPERYAPLYFTTVKKNTKSRRITEGFVMAVIGNENVLKNNGLNDTADNTGYLNILRVLSTFAVIMIHVFAPINSYFSNSLTETESYICIIFRHLWQWCVPIFVMITGVLFLNPEKEITLEKIIKKYFLRIVSAIILFGIPYCFLEILFDSKISFNINQIGIAVLNAVQGKSWDHMWYLYMVAGLYLCIPIIKIFVINASKDVIKYTLIVLFIFTSIIPSFENIMPYKFGIYIPINSVYIFYLILGYYIHYNKITINNGILWSLMGCYIFYVILMPLNKSFIDLSDGGRLKLTGYNSPIVVMVTSVIFLLFHKNNKYNKLIEKISVICFGIYLIHPLFINFLYKYIKFSPEKYPLVIVIVITVLVTLILSMGFSYIARKIKIIRRYVL
jgi:surface polysaccharide O-acyltransferase-like enzyme